MVTSARPHLVIHAYIHGVSKQTNNGTALFRILMLVKIHFHNENKLTFYIRNSTEIATTNFNGDPIDFGSVMFTGFMLNAPPGAANISVEFKAVPSGNNPLIIVRF